MKHDSCCGAGYHSAISGGDGRFEGQVTVEGITLTSPKCPRDGRALRSCEPWAGALTFRPRLDFPELGDLTIPVEYPMDASQWSVWDETTGERAVVVAAFATVFRPDGSNAKLRAKWWVRCVQ